MKLKYIGKKKPLTIKMPWLLGQYIFNEDPVEMDNRDAKWLLDNSPNSFVLVGEMEPIFEGSEEEEPLLVGDEGESDEDEIGMVCPSCGKAYKSEVFYNRHIEKCTGENG